MLWFGLVRFIVVAVDAPFLSKQQFDLWLTEYTYVNFPLHVHRAGLCGFIINIERETILSLYFLRVVVCIISCHLSLRDFFFSSFTLQQSKCRIFRSSFNCRFSSISFAAAVLLPYLITYCLFHLFLRLRCFLLGCVCCCYYYRCTDQEVTSN